MAPFKNKQQVKACFAQQAKGKKGWDCDKWAKETNMKALPKGPAKKPKK